MKKWVSFIVLSAFSLAPVAAFADSSADMMSMLESMKTQMSQMQRTIEQQNMRIQQLESNKVLETPQPNVPVSGAGATMSDTDFQKGLKDNLGEAFPWLKGVKYGGDLRLRYEAFSYDNRTPDAGSTTTAAEHDRNRFRMRLRWGMEKDFMDDWKAGFRLATGSTTDPNSTNQTLGNSGYFNTKAFNLERAYAIYEPNGMKDYGPIKGVKVGAGKFENPFLRYSTPIVWDGDVTPEGAYEQVNLSVINTEENKLNLQGTLGQFIVNENTGSETDAGIYGYQGVVQYSTYNFNADHPVDINFATSYYDYTNWFQTVTSNTASTSYLRTNSIVADDFRVLDLYPEVTFYVKETPLTLWYDYATNLANVGTDDAAQSGGNDIHDTDEAWGAGFKLGKAKKKGSWELFYGYYEIGANAVVAAFNDSDFGGPDQNGYTNRKGHKFGLGYQLTENMVLNWTGYYVQPLNPTASSSTLGLANSRVEDVFRSQLDVSYKF